MIPPRTKPSLLKANLILSPKEKFAEDIGNLKLPGPSTVKVLPSADMIWPFKIF